MERDIILWLEAKCRKDSISQLNLQTAVPIKISPRSLQNLIRMILKFHRKTNGQTLRILR